MKKIYQYIEFSEIEKKSKTSVFNCINRKSTAGLGIIKWYAPWRQYCFYPAENTIFSPSCLADISHFINALMEERHIKKMSKKKVNLKAETSLFQLFVLNEKMNLTAMR